MTRTKQRKSSQENKAAGKKKTPLRQASQVKPWIIKFANTEDATTGDSYEVFQFRKTLGRKGSLRIERDRARDPTAVLAALARKNAVLPPIKEAAEKLVIAAMQSEPRRHRLHVRHLGWLPKRRGFVLKRAVLGPQDEALQLRPPLWVNDRQIGVLKVRGGLEDWKAKVATPAMRSTRMMLVLAAAFAAPLLKVSGLQNFGINTFGRSKVGKTTALLVGASAIGIGSERNLPNWNATSNAFLETARGFNDLMLPANEVGLLAGKRGDAYGPIRERIYAFSEGRDRARLSSSTMASAWASSSWRGIFVSTAEYSFNDYAAFSGETRSAGEYARCLDVSAVAQGHASVFDSYPKRIKVSRQKRWARAELRKLRTNCERYHGAALEPYLAFLIAEDAGLRKKVASHCATFMIAVHSMRLDGALEHAGRNFALIYAGGCMAIEAGILPWTEDALLRAVETCFRAAVTDVQGHTDSLSRARSILKAKLRSNEVIAVPPGKALTPKRCAGFWEEHEGIRSFTIHATAFRGWFASRAQAVAVLRWLYEQGDLIVGRGKITPTLKSTLWAERSRRWPGGQVVKSISLRDPFPSTRSKKAG